MKASEHESEQWLVQRLRTQDERAMALFYRKYKPALYHIIWRIVRHKELAEDILQESMVKVWTAFPAYDTSKGRLFTWALNISRNLAIDRLREQQRLARHTELMPDDAADYFAATPTFRPEHIGVRDWLSLLAPSDRELAELLYVKGYTQAETAEELAVPLGTVKSRGRRIIRELAQVIRPGQR